ncbi:MAG TPA: deoxyguanosinetriphosphate triphosphohydrolase, partial [Candidatus Omnitrophica bacterium]|nr:deoxyguanosinetriphosphate triphosphohydrolase [Candidatus Omnitrophota bacterium]
MNREEYQRLEAKILAPYALKSSQTKGRRYKEKEDLYRTPFQRDRDRIIHSTAFRRLEYKTQVFVIHEGDYYRTRLTHSLEVAQIARSIARALSLNADLVEAIALGHDIGHTPFGHSGEDILNELLEDCGGFNHNLQGLRIVDYLESKYPEFSGLNLTWEVREGLLKHTTRYDNSYSDAGPYLLPDYAGRDSGGFCSQDPPTLEAQIVNLADEIAYDNHDIDDGITSGLLAISDFKKIALWREAEKKVKQEHSKLSLKFKKHQIIRALIDMDVKDVVKTSLINLKNIGSAKEAKSTGKRLVDFSKDMQNK